MAKALTYYMWYIDGEGGEGLCFTKNFRPAPYKKVLFTCDKIHELADWLVANDEEWNNKGRDNAMNYVIHLYNQLIDF